MPSFATGLAPYPASFYVAHKLFTGEPFPAGGTWGDILDGPAATDEQVITDILEAFKDAPHPPCRLDLRVWHITPGQPAEDCTEWALKTCAAPAVVPVFRSTRTMQEAAE